MEKKLKLDTICLIILYSVNLITKLYEKGQRLIVYTIQKFKMDKSRTSIERYDVYVLPMGITSCIEKLKTW